MARKTIHAAGGIVVRGGKSGRPLIAVVQRSKDERWVLPRGKLKRDENPLAGARREVVEETGHRVEVREYLGAITYTVRGQPKVVQFWRMRAAAQPSRDVTRDIVAVEWLPLGAAVRRLSFVLEKLFLLNIGRRALRRRAQRKRHLKRKRSTRRATRRASRHSAKRATKSHARKRPPKLRHVVARPATHVPAAHAQTPIARRNVLHRVFGRLRAR